MNEYYGSNARREYYDSRQQRQQQPIPNVEQIRRKSLAPGVHIKFNNRYRLFWTFKKFAIFLATVALTGGIIGASLFSGATDFKDNREIAKFLGDYDTVISTQGSTYRTGDRNQYHAYNERFIASGIVNSDNPEFETYAVYQRIKYDEIEGYLKTANLDRIISTMNYCIDAETASDELLDFDGCNSWDDFLTKRNCVVNGEPSNELYEEYIKQLAIIEMNQRDLEEQFKIGG